MKKLFYFLFISGLLFTSVPSVFSQGADCNTADPFCTGTTYTFPNSTNNGDLGPVDCLGSSPNPAWYFMEIDQNGSMTIDISQVDGGGNGIDVDFILWGPYTSLSAACATSLFSTSGVDCSYSTAAVETATIPSATVGEVYVLLLTNYSNVSGTITFSQSGGAGSADCSLLCGVQSFTANPGACNSVNNTYDVSGALTITNPPASGTVTITNSCGGTPVVLNAPFTSPINYSFTGLTSNGSSCTVSSTFSADATCNSTTTYTAPSSCVLVCNITSVTSSVGTINCAAQTFDATGQISFTNAPASGTLTVTSSCGGSQTFNAPFTSPQAFTISGIPANGASCTYTAVFSADATCTNNISLTSPTMPTASANNNGPVCENGIINLTSGTVSGATYSWSGPNGFSSTSQNPTINPITVSGSGVYTVTVTLNGCNATATTTVIINPAPSVTSGSDITICEGDTINLTANSLSGATYSWTGPNGYTSSQQNPVINPASTTNDGLYIVTATLNGCTGAPDTLDVTVIPTPVVNASSNSPICVGDALQLNASNVNGANYTWTGPNGFTSTSQNPLIDPVTSADAGTYSVIAIVNGCSSAPSSTNVTISDVNASFIATPSTGVSPLNVVFTNTTTGGTAYSWDYGNGNIENTTSLSTTQTYITDSTYTVTMIAVNADGCMDTVSMTISVVPNYFIIIPNVFSPNGDNTNDVFELQFSGVSSLLVNIYDRWGLFMYSYNSLTGSWNGQKDGKDASEGVYYYVIQVVDALDAEHIYSGHVTLTR